MLVLFLIPFGFWQCGDRHEECSERRNFLSTIIGFDTMLIESLSRLMSNCENIQVKNGGKRTNLREIFEFQTIKALIYTSSWCSHAKSITDRIQFWRKCRFQECRALSKFWLAPTPLFKHWAGWDHEEVTTYSLWLPWHLVSPQPYTMQKKQPVSSIRL